MISYLKKIITIGNKHQIVTEDNRNLFSSFRFFSKFSMTKRFFSELKPKLMQGVCGQTHVIPQLNPKAISRERARAAPVNQPRRTDEGAGARGVQGPCMIHTWNRCSAGQPSETIPAVQSQRVRKYRQEGGGNKREEENRKAHLAATGGVPHPLHHQKGQRMRVHKQTCHLAQAQTARRVHRQNGTSVPSLSL